MAPLGVFLLCISLADAVRGSSRTSGWPRTWAALATALTLGAISWFWFDVDSHGRWAWALGAVALSTWVVSSRAAIRATPGKPAATMLAIVAAAGLVIGVAGAAAAGPLAAAWPADNGVPWADPPSNDPERSLLLVSLFAVQFSTANFLVRMLLSAAGVPAEPNEKHVKGGRWLGPMERLFILGFGVAGEFTAASAVVAAKALLRLPEVNKDDGAGGGQAATRSRIAEHSEYLLLGSFASWLVAAACIGIALVYS